MLVVLKWEHFNLLTRLRLFDKFIFNCVQIGLKPIPTPAEHLSFLRETFFNVADEIKGFIYKYTYILNNNQNPQYCNGGDLADYLNGNFLFSTIFISFLQLQTLCCTLCESLKDKPHDSFFSQGNTERRHNSTFPAAIR